jgi:hypothetical protein
LEDAAKKGAERDTQNMTTTLRFPGIHWATPKNHSATPLSTNLSILFPMVFAIQENGKNGPNM